VTAGPGWSDSLPHFTLVSRVDCHLCDVMKAELGAFLAELSGLPAAAALAHITVLDVDSGAELKRRFGYKVPVLLADGEVLCSGRFDRLEVERLTRSPARGT
jgi:hypothetical protein